MKVYSFMDLFEIPTVPWVVKDIIPLGGFAMLYGLDGCGKSQLALELGYCIATGNSWLDHPIEDPSTVFYIAGERFEEQAKRIQAYPQDPSEETTFFMTNEAIPLDNPRDLKSILSTVQQQSGYSIKRSTFIFDTFQACGALGSETSILNSYEILRNLGITVIIIHHNRKLGQGLAKGDPERENPQPHGASPIMNPMDVKMYYERGILNNILTCKKNNRAPLFEDMSVELRNGRCILAGSQKERVRPS